MGGWELQNSKQVAFVAFQIRVCTLEKTRKMAQKVWYLVVVVAAAAGGSSSSAEVLVVKITGPHMC